MDPFLSLTLRTLKGAPLSCMIAMFIFDEPATLESLYLATGYDYYDINQAMRLLRSMRIVTGSARTSWTLSPILVALRQNPEFLSVNLN
jgi:hypothetical protein